MTHADVVRTEDFESAPQFLDALRLSHLRWQGRTRSESDWIFRGQRDAEWLLVPSAFRPPCPGTLFDRYAEDVRKRFAGRDWRTWLGPGGDGAPDKGRLAEAALHALTHALMVRDFVLLAHNAKHRVEVPPFLWHLKNDRYVLKGESTAFREYFHGKAMHEVFAIAQHHGIPTCLIDWTYNPLIAAYFAAEELIRRPDVAHRGRLAVWALRRQTLDYDLYLRRLTVTPTEVPFLDAQEGLFTWCPRAYLLYLRDGRFSSLQELAVRTAEELGAGKLGLPLLQKLTLPAPEASALVQLLWRERVSHAHLMPTFDNVTTALQVRSSWISEGPEIV